MSKISERCNEQKWRNRCSLTTQVQKGSKNAVRSIAGHDFSHGKLTDSDCLSQLSAKRYFTDNWEYLKKHSGWMKFEPDTFLQKPESGLSCAGLTSPLDRGSVAEFPLLPPSAALSLWAMRFTFQSMSNAGWFMSMFSTPLPHPDKAIGCSEFHPYLSFRLTYCENANSVYLMSICISSYQVCTKSWCNQPCMMQSLCNYDATNQRPLLTSCPILTWPDLTRTSYWGMTSPGPIVSNTVHISVHN